MKKILSLILSAVLMVECAAVSVSADNTADYTVSESYSSSLAANDDEQLSFNDYIVEQVESFAKEIDVSKYAVANGWDSNECMAQYQNVIYANPQLFYVTANVGCTFSVKKGMYKLTKIDYTVSKKTAASMIEKFDEAVDKALECVNDSMTDVEKALAVHDYIILNNTYDTTYSNYTAYDALVTQKSVCQGYALAYEYIMSNCLGIDCTMITSDSMNHAWNYIKIDGKWYHVDLTLDDPLFTGTGEKIAKNDAMGRVLHKNFMLSDSAIKKTPTPHKGWTTNGLPKASSKKYDKYFWKNTESGMFKVGNYWYYIQLDPNSPCLDFNSTQSMDMYSLIKKYSFKTNKSSTVYKITSTWYKWGKSTGLSRSWYTESYARLAVYNGKLYFNTSDGVYSISTNGKNLKKVASPSTTKGFIYGIRIYDNKLYCTLKQAPVDGDKNVKKYTLK